MDNDNEAFDVLTGGDHSMQTTTTENNKVSPTSPIAIDPGERIRNVVLSVSIPLVCIGILLVCLSGTEMSVGYWGETHLTRDGVRFLTIGELLAAIGTSILLPGLSYAAWKTSRTAVEKVCGLLSNPDQMTPCDTNLKTLAGSTNGWALFWLIGTIGGIVAIVCGLVGILIGSDDAILLPSAGYALPITASAYVYSPMLAWFLHVMMRAQAEDADRVRQSYRARFKPTLDVNALFSELVSIPGEGYKIGRSQVTQSQWMAVMGENPSHFKGADNPVEQVSRNDCQEFLEKLNALPAVREAGLVFRLPTDAEWEYACCAGATGKYCKLVNGTEITEDTLGEVAWFEDNSGGKTHPVGQKQPNAFGLYDMHGNVWEWTQTAEDPVCRGGGWFNSARYCESSYRNWFSPSNRLNYLGFRLCASGRAD